ncbi:hypothetical protein PGB90_009308 [Kerria lacca]
MFKIFICMLLLITELRSQIPFNSPDSFFHSLNREKRYVTYPSGTAIGLLVAIALPIEVPEENLYFSLNFEANYNLPDNITQYYNSDIARVLHSITRKSTYDFLKRQLASEGYNGEECLLRIICETSNHEIAINGLLEAILLIIFRPSTSQREDLLGKYKEAEIFGSTHGNCSRKYSHCKMSIVDFVSILK